MSGVVVDFFILGCGVGGKEEDQISFFFLFKFLIIYGKNIKLPFCFPYFGKKWSKFFGGLLVVFWMEIVHKALPGMVRKVSE